MKTIDINMGRIYPIDNKYLKHVMTILHFMIECWLHYQLWALKNIGEEVFI